MRDRLGDLKGGAANPPPPPEPEKSSTSKGNKKNKEKEVDLEKAEESEALKAFFDQIGAIRDGITNIKTQIDQIEALHQQSLNVISEEQSAQKTKELERLMDRTNKQASDIQNKLKAIDAENKKLAKAGDSNESRIRTSQHSTITKKFLDVMMEYKEIQKKYQDKYKQRMQRQILIVNPQATEADITAMMDTSATTAVFSKQILQTNQKAEAKRALQDIQDRHADIVRLERSIIELQQLFIDMSVLVAAQGEMLDQVEIQVNNAVENTDKGVEALKEAVKYQKRSRKKMIILLICLVVICLAVGLGAGLGTKK